MKQVQWSQRILIGCHQSSVALPGCESSICAFHPNYNIGLQQCNLSRKAAGMLYSSPRSSSLVGILTPQQRLRVLRSLLLLEPERCPFEFNTDSGPLPPFQSQLFLFPRIKGGRIQAPWEWHCALGPAFQCIWRTPSRLLRWIKKSALPSRWRSVVECQPR